MKPIKKALVPSKPQPVFAVDDDAQMGAQLTAQYHAAVGGMRSVLLFGAMLKVVRNRIVVSARGQNSATRGPTAKGDGIKAWIEEFAPEINRQTAYRFEQVLDSVAEQFTEVNAPALEDVGGFESFVLTPSAQLSPTLRAKQQELWEFVDGTSQRSWLDRLGNGNGAFDPTRLTGKAKDAWEKIVALCDPYDDHHIGPKLFTPEEYEEWHEDALVMRGRVEAGEIPPARAWAGLRGRAATHGTGRNAVDHYKNLATGLTKLRNSLEHWDELPGEDRAEIEAVWQELLARLPGSWKATIKKQEGWK